MLEHALVQKFEGVSRLAHLIERIDDVGAGDLIVELAGLSIDGIEDYVAVLGQLHVGEKVSVKVTRDGKAREFEVVLTSRNR